MSRQQSEAEERALLTALTGFSEKAGHDLAGPLNQASSLLALFIKKYSQQLDGDADQLLDYLQSGAQRMESAARGVRKFMTIAGTPATSESIDLNDTLAAAEQLLGPEIAASGAVIAAETLPVVYGDGPQLTAVFECLLENAMKFREAEATPRVKVSSRRAGEMVEIEIQDDGIGVESDDAQVLFVAFRRLNGREYPGPGLGLAMARLIVERHGGQITIEPHRDGAKGSCVRFTLRPSQL